MQYTEQDNNDVIAREAAREAHHQQLRQTAEKVASLYAFEHEGLDTAEEQHTRIASVWEEVARDSGGAGDAVRQLGKALNLAYQLAGDTRYTIADRLAVKKYSKHEKRRSQGDGKATEEGTKDPLAERFIHDFTLARLALSGGLRQPEKIKQVANSTRTMLVGNTLPEVVRAGLDVAPICFPIPRGAARRPIAH